MSDYKREQIRTAALSMSMQGPHERRMMSTISRSYGWMNEQIKAREVR